MKAFGLYGFIFVLTWVQGVVLVQAQADDIVLPMNAENFGPSWERLDGPAGRTISAVIQTTNSQLRYQIHSASHSFKAFLEGRYPCISPDSGSYYDSDYDFIESLPFRETRWVAVHRKDRAPIIKPDDLRGKRVGLLYSPHVLQGVVPQKGAVYDVYGDLATNLRKLEKGRLDAVVTPQIGLHYYLQKNRELGELTFDPDQPIAVVQDRVVCHDTTRGQEVISLVNEALNRLRLSRTEN